MGPACSGVERVDKLNVSFGDAFKDKLRYAISDVDYERRLTLIDECNLDFAGVVSIDDACSGGDAFE